MELFTMGKDEELTSDILRDFINQHKARLPRYNRLMDMYQGKHPILKQENKELHKPDNRIMVNFAKYIVDTLNGYFMGNPVKTDHPVPTVADKMRTIAKRNSQNDNNAELAKMCSIYGHAYEFLWIDDEVNNRVTYMDPHEAFIIYDDSIAQEPLYGVHILQDDEGRLYGTIYSTTDERDFSENDKGEIVIGAESTEHYFGDVPLVEYIENEERQSAFENVESLINAYNKALSEKANDVDYFADAYLAILGVDLDEDTLKSIRDNRIINLKDGDMSKIVVEFLDKPNADTTQENLIDRLEKLIFQISMVSNISDENFGTSSGISLKFKLQSMENVALMKERKFNNGMIRRFKMMFAIPTNFGVDKESYLDIDYIFTRNIPNNIAEEAETAGKLAGITSKRTQLAVLSAVDNVQDELDQIDKESEEQAKNSFNRDMMTPFVSSEGVDEDGQEE
ncbi:phage portal protein [Amphibacillus sp. MSJ-3]|uniref:phage portal protein n=1 Tax=Amphibacillus sp. MSJ-3 TaxID=2841505 RepID=UPI001C0F02AF|nr:phage portal protein [Amphibacillus sp. MSJ-3]MBU5594906.1 phage portal protein [Amphibacillus sp. MSJ-3]